MFDENPDPKQLVTDQVCEMFETFRALGISITIIYQRLTAIPSAVLDNAGTKMVFRTDGLEARAVLAHAMGLSLQQVEDIPRLPPGYAYLKTKGLYRARLVQAKNLHDIIDLTSPYSDDDLVKELKTEPAFQRHYLLRRYGEFQRLSEAMDAFDRKRLALILQIDALEGRYSRILSTLQGRRREKALHNLGRKIESLAEYLGAITRHFLHREYRRYMCPAHQLAGLSGELVSFRQSFLNRFKVIKQGVREARNALHVIRDRCQPRPGWK